MDFKDLLEKSWKSFTESLPALIINTLLLTLVSVFTLGILAPVCTAGYTQSLLLAIREGRKPEPGDLFSHMRLFLPLLAFGIVAFIVVSIGMMILVLPGIVAGIALFFFCLYLLPLMTDKELGLIEAVKESSRMALEDPVSEHLAVVAIYIVITAIGSAIPFGFIVTMPIATLFILYAFEEKCGPPPKKIEKPTPEAPKPTPPPPPPPQPEAKTEEKEQKPAPQSPPPGENKPEPEDKE